MVLSSFPRISEVVWFFIAVWFYHISPNRVGGGQWPADLSHHRTYRSVYGGSLVFAYLLIVAR